jgi:hypothetical protein
MAMVWDPTGGPDGEGAYVDDGTTDVQANSSNTLSNGNSGYTGWTPPPGATQNADGTYTQKFDDGSTISFNPDGSIAKATDTTGANYTAGTNVVPSSSNWSNLLNTISKSTGIPQNLLSAPGAVTAALAVASAAGGNNIKTALSGQSGLTNLVDVNQGIAAGQAGQGQAYFTPTQYVAPADVATAQDNAAKQAALMTPPKPTDDTLPAANIGTNWSNKGIATQAQTPFTNPQQPTGIQQIATPQQITDMQNQISAMQNNPAQIENLSSPVVQRAHGGPLTGIAAHGRYLQGSTDGMADKLDTSIDGVQPAKLSHGEFVIPADVVSHLGNGNSDAGAKRLYEMMDKIRMARTGTKKQGREINPSKFMPGGIAGYASGGGVRHFATGSTPTNTTSAAAPTATTPTPASSGYGTSQTTGVSNYVAPYVTDMLSKEQALANAPTPVYTGELAAGPSSLQNQYFANANQLAQTGITPTQFTSGTFDANAAQQYMNPYLQASLNPQLQALQLTAQQGEQGDLSKLTQAGAFGGTRQAVLQGQDAYNLLSQQSNLIGQGYNTAYNNAMNQFNTANSQSLQAQQNQEAANEAAANYGLASNAALGTAGATQQGIKQAQDTASLNQFNQQAAYPQTVLTNESNMLSNLPISTATTTPNTTAVSQFENSTADLASFYNQLQNYMNSSGSGTSGSSSSSGSSGTTGSGTSSGTTSDVRAKEHIELIHVRADGLGVYEFEYKPEFKNTPTAGHGRYRGLMAQEVEQVYPNAVFTLDSGYKAIKYAEVPA